MKPILKLLMPLLAMIGLGACGSHHKPPPNPISNKATLSKNLDEASVATNPNKNLYWGDLHVHTCLSFDAYFSGTLANADDAYNYAKGKTISIFGRDVKLREPLDFCAITDHSELMGETYSISTKGAKGHNSLAGMYIRSIYKTDSPLMVDTAKQWNIFLKAMDKAEKPSRTHPSFFYGYETTMSAWDIAIDAAEKHYRPGEFTTFAGFEFTLMTGRAHLHRNIIFRDMNVPAYPMSSIEIENEKGLWDWMQQATENGSTLMSIPHNTNLSEGHAFDGLDRVGNPITKEYAEMEANFERLVEIHQVKGNSEVHAAFWKNDEFADFENHTFGEPNKASYVRYGLQKGLQMQRELGVNPYKLGFIGSTDTHNATPGNTEEDDEQIGNKGVTDIDALNRSFDKWPLDMSQKTREVVNPGGLVAVWADANTRGHIYDALAKREVYATSGNRIELRFFGGKDFNTSSSSQEMVADAYQKGVPMGGDLPMVDGKPQFLVWAKKAKYGANLERIQIIKGWCDKEGGIYEETFDVAVSDRKLPEGETAVNTQTGEWNKNHGSEELKVVWTDEDFNAENFAFYYVRVLEVPTASWRLWDMLRYGYDYSKEKGLIIQERAWSSPIWYSPN
ncbi:MAG: DUF3604 domain-containing protein [Flavobacteriales bacterium]|nr:DUF3604 domain-containing protein [Flavobacteriales bacterium]